MENSKFTIHVLVKEDYKNVYKLSINADNDDVLKHINDQVYYLLNTYNLKRNHIEIGIIQHRNIQDHEIDLKDIVTCFAPTNSVNHFTENDSDTTSLESDYSEEN